MLLHISYFSFGGGAQNNPGKVAVNKETALPCAKLKHDKLQPQVGGRCDRRSERKRSHKLERKFSILFESRCF
jgi:hypothetical protein